MTIAQSFLFAWVTAGDGWLEFRLCSARDRIVVCVPSAERRTGMSASALEGRRPKHERAMLSSRSMQKRRETVGHEPRRVFLTKLQREEETRQQAFSGGVSVHDIEVTDNVIKFANVAMIVVPELGAVGEGTIARMGTRPPRVAPKGGGVVITADVPASKVVDSPNIKEVVLKQSDKIVPENEKLVRGKVRGKPRKVR